MKYNRAAMAVRWQALAKRIMPVVAHDWSPASPSLITGGRLLFRTVWVSVAAVTLGMALTGLALASQRPELAAPASRRPLLKAHCRNGRVTQIWRGPAFIPVDVPTLSTRG
jgi:hypothetical protein